MEKKKLNLILLIVGLIYPVMISIGLVYPSVLFGLGWFVKMGVLAISFGLIIFALFNYSKMWMWLKILLAVVMGVILAAIFPFVLWLQACGWRGFCI